jgi:hypothetical protein
MSADSLIALDVIDPYRKGIENKVNDCTLAFTTKESYNTVRSEHDSMLACLPTGADLLYIYIFFLKKSLTAGMARCIWPFRVVQEANNASCHVKQNYHKPMIDAIV